MAIKTNTILTMSNKNKIPWPTKAAMEQVYELNLWGTNNQEFYSGSGSHDSFIVKPYVEAIKNELISFEKPVSICDLGCGDFNIGKQLVPFSKKYCGVDIVSKLIKFNTQKFIASNLEFICLDIAKDNLPDADCVIIRQVLQHLSNNEVQNIIGKLYQYKYVILTEHLPLGDFEPNKDIISGQGIRIKKQSGINLLVPPFNFNIKKEKLIQKIVLPNKKGIIKTVMYTLS